MRTAVLALVLLASVFGARATAQKKFEDERMRKAWSYLTPAEQAEALERFDGEAPTLPTFQNRLIKHASSLAEVDLGLVPRDAPTPFYEPAQHAPAQPIARHRLEPDSALAKRMREQMFGKEQAVRPLRAGWRYDWGARQIVRTAEPDERDRRAENALVGHAPYIDWAMACVERALDGGVEQKTLAAFGHAYTDREGNVFPGITLYDAWGSGTEMEMPDVDSLGLVHDLMNEWKRWVAPVSPTEHDALYGSIGKLFVPAHRYRGIREALARSYLIGAADLRAPYDKHLDRFHSLWDSYASAPAELAPRLPSSDQLDEFLGKWTVECEESAKLRDAGRKRRTTLEADAGQVRALWIQILTESGALERKARPAPDPTKK